MTARAALFSVALMLCFDACTCKAKTRGIAGSAPDAGSGNLSATDVARLAAMADELDDDDRPR